MILASHEGGPNSWFLLALLVPAVVFAALWIIFSWVRMGRFEALVPLLIFAVTAVTLHVSVVTWRRYKDVAMCQSWEGSSVDMERCIAERRERGRGPWGVLVARNGD
ncbi:MAG: hypothetical protein M3357_12870 [Actinomycetota bacterium]|nr:hypothetical protein [Actinomycetota bacterium]